MAAPGKLFACQHYGLEPDLMTVAKSMAGGLPMGACLIGPRVTGIKPMTHGSTFGGNPLACAAALATLEVMRRDDLPGRAGPRWANTCWAGCSASSRR